MAWRRYLSPRTVRVDASGRLGEAESGFGPRAYALSRARCSFARVRLAAPGAAAREAARLKIAHAQPHAKTAVRIVPDPEAPKDGPREAGAWSWDASALLPNGAPIGDARALPETLFRAPLADGARLVHCIDGVEGEVWRNGALVASRWWAAPPNAREWSLFLRAAKAPGGETVATPPQPIEAPLRADMPIFDRDPDEMRRVLAPSRIAAALAALLIFGVAFQGARIASFERQKSRYETRYAEAIATNEEALSARRRALALRAQAERAAMGPKGAAFADIVTALLEPLPTDAVEVRNVRFVGDEIEATGRVFGAVEGPELVQRLEASPLLSEVFVDSASANAIIIRARTVPIIGEAGA